MSILAWIFLLISIEIIRLKIFEKELKNSADNIKEYKNASNDRFRQKGDARSSE